jgi:hypothetical protein
MGKAVRLNAFGLLAPKVLSLDQDFAVSDLTAYSLNR